MRAYVVITAGPGKAREIAHAVAHLPGVKMSNACWGSPDVFAVVEVSDQKEQAHARQDSVRRGRGAHGDTHRPRIVTTSEERTKHGIDLLCHCIPPNSEARAANEMRGRSCGNSKM